MKALKMSKTESSGGCIPKPKEPKELQKDKNLKVKSKTRIVVRHLPPTMSADEFLQQIGKLPEHVDFCYVNADWSLAPHAMCRAYITLNNFNDVLKFRDRFDGHIFVDRKGAKFRAMVEFAPFQGLPGSRIRVNDDKVNTIEAEPHYQEFLVKLLKQRADNGKPNNGSKKLELQSERGKKKTTTTPLLEYLAEQEREEQRTCEIRCMPHTTFGIGGWCGNGSSNCSRLWINAKERKQEQQLEDAVGISNSEPIVKSTFSKRWLSQRSEIKESQVNQAKQNYSKKLNATGILLLETGDSQSIAQQHQLKMKKRSNQQNQYDVSSKERKN